jgi:cell division protein FtsW
MRGFVTTTLVFCVAALTALGTVMLVSASTATPEARYLTMQPVWVGLGFLAFLTAALSNYGWLKKYPVLSWLIFAVAVTLLVLVLVPGLGIKIKGARRWLGFGGIRFQPSEIAKLALIILLAWYGDRFQRRMPECMRGLIIPGLLIGGVTGLIFLEPDVGTTLLLGAVGCGILFMARVKLRYLLPPVLLALGGVGAFVWFDPTRSDRIYSWLHLEETKLDVGLQVYQALVSIASGGLYGLGLGDGMQKLGFVPELHTDFIFSVIGEELGLCATVPLLTAYLLIVLCGCYIAAHARDTLGRLLAIGITLLIGLQAFLNIAVVTNLLPNKGLPLPFISSGGSNLVVLLAGVGLLVSVARHSAVAEELADPTQEPHAPPNPFQAGPLHEDEAA